MAWCIIDVPTIAEPGKITSNQWMSNSLAAWVRLQVSLRHVGLMAALVN